MNQQQKLSHMNQIALQARNYASCPYSHFPVGSCILGADGQFYSGCNIQNAIDTVCAERNAILKMVQNGCRQIKQVYVITQKSEQDISPPCGFCRQYIKQFSKNDDQVLVHVGSLKNGFEKTFKFSQLYPYPFGPPSKGIHTTD